MCPVSGGQSIKCLNWHPSNPELSILPIESSKVFLEITWLHSQSPGQNLDEKDTPWEGQVSPPDNDGKCLLCSVWCEFTAVT